MTFAFQEKVKTTESGLSSVSLCEWTNEEKVKQVERREASREVDKLGKVLCQQMMLRLTANSINGSSGDDVCLDICFCLCPFCSLPICVQMSVQMKQQSA